MNVKFIIRKKKYNRNNRIEKINIAKRLKFSDL